MDDEPPPPRRQRTNGRWDIVALACGCVAYLGILYRFRSYSERNQDSAAAFAVFGIAVLVLGLALSRLPLPVRAASFLVAGVWAAHAGIIVIDLQEDPSHHNLLPFEFIMLGVLCLPAYGGALLGWCVRRHTRA